MRDPRRVSPRIDVEALCWEIIGEKETSALAVDLSTEGLRIERPYLGGRIEREMPLQLEVPGIDEVMWAKADVVFDKVVPAKVNAGPFGLIRRTGFHIALAAARDLRMISDFVYDRYERFRADDEEENIFARAYRSR
jgi:hypothetical protein